MLGLQVEWFLVNALLVKRVVQLAELKNVGGHDTMPGPGGNYKIVLGKINF